MILALSLIIGIPILVWIFVGTMLFIECEDLPYAWPYFALQFLIGRLPGVRARTLMNEAYNEGVKDMKRSGTLENPMRGRADRNYMNHKNEKIYNAYIEGGNKILTELAEEEAGISLGQLRKTALEKQDKARLEQVQRMKEIRKEVLAPPEDKWQTEFERITK